MLLPLVRILLGVRLKGRAARRRAEGMIVAPNHQSWIDPYLVQYAVYPHQLTFLMTEIYFDMPLAGLYFRASGARPIREGGPSVAGLRAAREALEDGKLICLFPEGEITTTGRLGRGRRGVARLARRTGARVLPVGIRGAINVYSKVQPRPRLATVEIRVGEAMVYDEEETADGEQRFTQRLMARIESLAYGE